MDLLTVIFGVIFGIFLTIGDGMASRHRMRAGFKPGLAIWVAVVAVPLAVAIYLSWKIALVGAVAATVLSGLMFWQARTGRGELFKPGL